jgi:WD40 repeat protein
MSGKTHYRGKSYLNPKQQYISPDGTRALSYDEYGVVNNFPRYGNSEIIFAGTLWDVPNSKVIKEFSFPYVDIYAFSHDLGSIAYLAPTGITLLDIQSGSTRGEILFSSCLGKLTFSPDGNILAGYFRNMIYFCDPLTGKVNHAISVPTGFISSIAFSPDGKFVGSTGQTWGNYLSASKKNYDTFAYIWNVSNGQLVSVLQTHGDTLVIKFSPDGRYIATGAGIANAGPGVATPHDKKFMLWSWDGQNATKVTEREFDYGVGKIAFSPDGQQLLLATTGAPYYKEPPRVYLYDIASDMLSQSFYEQTRCSDPPYIFQFSPTGKQFVLGDSCAVRKISISKDASNPEFPPANHEPTTSCCEFSQLSVSPNLSVLVSFANIWADGHQIKISDIQNTRSVNIQTHRDYISITFAPDGKVIYGESNILGVISVWGIPKPE